MISRVRSVVWATVGFCIGDCPLNVQFLGDSASPRHVEGASAMTSFRGRKERWMVVW